MAAAERPGLLLPPGTTWFSSLARRRVKVVGKPEEGKPHVRFDVAGSGNQHLGQAPLPDHTIDRGEVLVFDLA